MVKNSKKEEIIEDYLDSLDKMLKEKQLYQYWVFPDRKVFKRIQKSTTDMDKTIKSDLNKYKNRKIAYIKIDPNTKNCTSHQREIGIYLSVSISIFQIDEKGSHNNPKLRSWGCRIVWHEKDFKCTKLSFKLLEEIIKIVADKKHKCLALYGVPITKIVNDLKKKNIDIDHVLIPLAGI